ncbi:glutamine synthetase [Rhizobium sp. KVB221]|uniref:Glutamine synthetase n=1 Tax=Rhizobium setariae TaxID=2801340 RepID=A0A936YRW1_9HYPH|nr:glutamine synthetase family protein [Rhizobium setariae]MBL0371457.1 glutamine synthetase [Rhizobium setariae]
MSELESLLEDKHCQFATIAASDTNGFLRGQLVSRKAVLSIAESGMGMSPVTLALDPTDVVLPMPGVSDDNSDFHDAKLRLDPGSWREIPWHGQGKRLLFLADFDGGEAAICPRALLKKIIAEAHAEGFSPKYGLELEYTLFNETPQSAKDKGYRDLTPATTFASHDLVLYQSTQSEWYDALIDMCADLRIDLYKAHEEIGAGFMEVCIGAGRDLGPADQAVVLRTFLKALAIRNGKMVTFMPRWSEAADSQSTHIHLSLVDKTTGKPLFWREGDPRNMSPLFRHFLGGLQAYLGDLMLIFAPSVNAYRRFAPGTFAPPSLNWGYENRTASLRVVGDDPGSLRFENRLPGSDSNPYLSTAATLAAGLAGIRGKIEPREELLGNGYAQEIDPALLFPRTMHEAIDRFRNSAFARKALGDRFVESFAATRQAQLDEFARKVPDVELARFFELG